VAPPPRPEQLARLDKRVVQEVLKPDMLLMENNKRFKLDNIRVPPYEDASAINELRQEFIGKPVTIYTYEDVKKDIDRYGVPITHIVRDDGVWIQEDMVSKGLAWAVPSDKDPEMVFALYKAEDSARVQKLGFWKDPAYEIKNVNEISDYMYSFQIVKGQILSANSTKDYVYFNFGKDWKTDFTIRVTSQFWYEYSNSITHSAQLLNISSWADSIVLVRGWVESNNGPMIEVTDGAQIQFITGPDFK
jgi:hypothetical protein